LCQQYSSSRKCCSSSLKLTIVPSDANILHLQPQRLTLLWNKAEEILSYSQQIMPAAGNDDACQIANSIPKLYTSPPHFIYFKKSVRSTVTKSTPNICQHSLATAEYRGVASQKKGGGKDKWLLTLIFNNQ
jgi:hypothetical protein